MGILYDDVVIVSQSDDEDEPSVITVNCPDKTGLGCDLCRILLYFGLSIVRVDIQTDGKWCYLVFWVVGKLTTEWALLKKRLVEACPSFSSASGISYYWAELSPPQPPDVYLLQFCGCDRKGLLHDVTKVLSELELTIKRVKVSTTPDGRVIDLFFLTDSRELMHTKKRQQDTYESLKDELGDAMISCDIEIVGPETTASSQTSLFLPSAITEDVFRQGLLEEKKNGCLISNSVSVQVDNTLSPGHSLLQIMCQDHKGLLYDIMRTMKDYNIQISYGRCTSKERECEMDLFIVHTDRKKIIDPSKQEALRSRLRLELTRPLRVTVVSRGPDTELLVANPVELSGKGRPLVFYDITLALKRLDICVFSADIGRHIIDDREWEVYRVLLDEKDCLAVPRKKIEEGVWKMLMGWE